MKVKVLKTYNDLQLNRNIKINTIMSFDKERAEQLEALGIVKIICEEERDKVQEVANLIETNDVEIKIPEKETKIVKKRKKK